MKLRPMKRVKDKSYQNQTKDFLEDPLCGWVSVPMAFLAFLVRQLAQQFRELYFCSLSIC